MLDAVQAYRAAFRPSAMLAEPYVIVAADVVVAPDDAARHLAAPYGLWIRSIRCGRGAIPFPSPEQAAAHTWTQEDSDLVADRVDTQCAGSPSTVARHLRMLRDVTSANELLITHTLTGSTPTSCAPANNSRPPTGLKSRSRPSATTTATNRCTTPPTGQANSDVTYRCSRPMG